MFKNLFRRSTVQVQMIEALSNETIGVVDLKPEQLPASFDKPTTLHLAKQDWEVVKAEPRHATEFTQTRTLTLWLKPVLKMDPSGIRYAIPTISNELPGLSAAPLFDEYTLTLHEDDWRQMEFLPLALLPVIQEEMSRVEEILFPEDDPDFDSTKGFDQIHVRSRLGQKHLSLSLEAFCDTAGITQKGRIALLGYPDYVQQGFALRSPNHSFYGIAEEGVIKELCLAEFDVPDEELVGLLERYDLALVAWCRGSITSF